MIRACDNPFSAQRIERIRYRCDGVSIEGLVGRLEQMNYWGAIVGPDGSGKTTLLEEVGHALCERGFRVRHLFVNDSMPLDGDRCRRFLAELERGEIVLADGADLVARAVWHFFRKDVCEHGGGLVVTSHRQGVLPTLVECSTTPELLEEIVLELLGAARTLDRGVLGGIYSRHGGNIRECLRELYDAYANDGMCRATR